MTRKAPSDADAVSALGICCELPANLEGLSPEAMSQTLDRLAALDDDLSRRQQVAKVMRKSEATYRALFEGTAEGILMADVHTQQFQFANPAICRMLGYTAEEMLHLGVEDIHPRETLGQMWVEFDHLTHGSKKVAEVSCLRKDGSVFDASITASLIVIEECRFLLGFFTDISERKRKDGALRDSAALLNATQQLSKVGGWVWNVQQQSMHFTEETYRIHGMVANRLEAGSKEYVTQSVECYDPADRNTIRQAFKRCAELGEPYDLEFPFTNFAGRRMWIRTAAKPVWEDGRIVKVIGNIVDLTELKQATEALRASEAKYRNLHESMMDAFASVDLTGRILESNRSFQEMVGYTNQELLHLTFLDITPAKWHAFEAQVVAEQILVKGDSGLYQKEYRRKDGTILPVELRTFLIRDAAGQPVSTWAIIRDITLRLQAKQSLRDSNRDLECRVAARAAEIVQSNARFYQLAEATFEGIAITAGGVLLDGNAQQGVIHGYALDEMIGRPVADFIAPESQELVAQRIHRGDETSYEYFGVRKDGSIFPAEAHGRMGIWMGHPMRITAVRDLSQIKKSAARFQAQQTELEQALRLSLVSEICAGIIHQIGQPICAIEINASAVTARLQHCKVQSCGSLKIIKNLEEAVASSRDIMTQLRMLIQPELGYSSMQIDFNDLVAGVYRLLRPEAETRGVVLDLECGQNLPPVMANAVQLNQVILILVRNAFDACVGCLPQRQRVTLTTRALAGDRIELGVRDAGAGISPAAMTQMFAPFFSTKAEGMGIGLRLSRTIVQVHGGSLEGCNNADGFGAMFRVILPAHLGADYTKV